MTFPLLLKKSLTLLVALTISVMVLCGAYIAWHGGLGLVWAGFMGLGASWLVFPFALLPAAMAAGIMRVVAMSHPKTARGMGIFSVAYIHFVLSLYAAGSFYIAGRSDVGLVYGVAAAVAPWAVFCLKDRENLMFILFVWMMFAAASATAFWQHLSYLSFMQVFLSMFGMMLAMAGIQALVERMTASRAA